MTPEYVPNTSIGRDLSQPFSSGHTDREYKFELYTSRLKVPLNRHTNESSPSSHVGLNKGVLSHKILVWSGPTSESVVEDTLELVREGK